jgi:hypothetical protein
MLNKHNLSIASFASKEVRRYTLNGILVNPDSTVATDGHRLLWVSGAPDRKSADYPQVPGFAGASDEFASFILNREAALAISKVTPTKESIPILNHVAVSADGSAIAVTDLERPQVFPVRPLAGKYPNYEAVIPKWEDAAFRVTLDASYLAEIGKMFAGFVSDRSHPVTLSFYKDKLDPAAPLSIEQSSVRFDGSRDDQGMTAVLMPVRGIEDRKGTYGWAEREAKREEERKAKEAKEKEKAEADANAGLRTEERAEEAEVKGE